MIKRGYFFWLVLSSLVVLWDTAYVLYRPHTMQGGSLFGYFSPYVKYIQIDTLYGNVKDRFVVVQAECNLVEVFLQLLSVAIYVLSENQHGKRVAGLIAVIAACFTFWKTIIYLMYGTDHIHLDFNNFLNTFLIFILPTSFWLVMPLWGIMHIGGNLVGTQHKQHSE